MIPTRFSTLNGPFLNPESLFHRNPARGEPFTHFEHKPMRLPEKAGTKRSDASKCL